MSKAELIWISPRSLGTYHEHASCCEMNPVCVPHYLVPAAGVPNIDELKCLFAQWEKATPGKLSYVEFARHVLDVMGLKEVGQ